MKKLFQDCPWYVWTFSFFTGFGLAIWNMLQLAYGIMKDKHKFNLLFTFYKEFFLTAGALFLVPLMVLSNVLERLAPGSWYWAAVPCAYVLGAYLAARMWAWRKKYLK